MPTDIRILVARRAWEFRPDDLRLTVLSMPVTHAVIKNHFEFQTAVVGTPMPTFGPAVQSIPPGVVFDTGVVHRGRQAVPIRFLHFETQRIVVDVAGPSDAAEEVYNQLRQLLSKEKASDGSAVVGQPFSRREISHLSAKLSVGIESLFVSGLGDLLRSFADSHNADEVVVPNMFLKTMGLDSEFQGIVDGDPAAFLLAPRAGYPISEKQYFSAAPLSTSRHVEYVSEVEQLLIRSVGVKTRPDAGATQSRFSAHRRRRAGH